MARPDEERGELGRIARRLSEDDPAFVAAFSEWRTEQRIEAGWLTPGYDGLIVLVGMAIWIAGPVLGVLATIVAVVAMLSRHR